MQFKKYPKIRSFGQDGTEDILDGDIVIQPKVDGSNVAIYVYGNEETKVARRNGFIDFGARQFQPFVDWVASIEETLSKYREELSDNEGFIFYGEFSDNQNKLKYDSKSPFILFDVLYDDGTFVEAEDWQGPKGEFLSYSLVKKWADRLNCDLVPVIYEGDGGEWSLEKLEEIVDRESYLGGCKEEGIVVKRYGALTRYHRVYFTKLVAEDFKEKMNVSTKPKLTSSMGDWIADTYFTEARLRKGIQKLKEDGQWDDSFAKKNIGKLIGTVTKDIHEEAYQDIADKAAKIAWRDGAKVIATKVAPALDKILTEG